MRDKLTKISLWEVMDTEVKVNDQWVKFTDRLLKKIERFIPRREPVPGNRNRRKFITPLDSKALRKMFKKKHRAWTRYMDMRESEHYHICCTYKNQVRNITKQMRVMGKEYSSRAVGLLMPCLQSNCLTIVFYIKMYVECKNPSVKCGKWSINQEKWAKDEYHQTD